MPLDSEIAALLERQKGQPPRSALTVEETRAMMRRSAALAGTPPELHSVADISLPGGVAARDYRPAARADLPLVLFFHGGRFFSGDLESHDPLCRILAASTGCRLVAVDYRLAPEHPFPAAAEDASAALGWALRQGVPVAVAGDSAGANLAAGAAWRRRDPMVRCQVLIYPMIDATCAMPAYTEYAAGYGPGAEDMRRGWQLYLPEGSDPRDPLASPLHAPDVTGLPPALVLTAEYDTLRDEGEAYAHKLQLAGVPVTLTRYGGMIHGFFTMPGAIRAAGRAVSDVSIFCRERMLECA
jgi:acetyl esterase